MHNVRLYNQRVQHNRTTCEGRDEPIASGGQILETKKQPETVLLKYFYFPPENLPSRCHGFIPTFTYITCVHVYTPSIHCACLVCTCMNRTQHIMQQLLTHLASQSSYCPTVFMNSTTQCNTTVISPQSIDPFVYLDYFTTVAFYCRCPLVLV